MGKPKIDNKNSRSRGISKGNHSFNPDRSKTPGVQKGRDRATVKRLLMYRGGKPQRDASGKIVRPAPFQSRLASGTVARVEPNRKWFGNTRVIGQNALQRFQEELGKARNDPYQLVMSKTKLPVTLLNEKAKHSQVHILQTESFENTFGPKAHRKRPTINVADMAGLVNRANQKEEKYDEAGDKHRVTDGPDYKDEARQMVFKAGQSKRIWNELYKVIDSSDVIIQVLDVRDPMGTRSSHVEKYIRKEKSHKHLIFVLNKCDLVPTWVTQRWVATLSAEYPTLAFHASITNPFGKGALIQILRQFGKLHNDCKQISVGFIGYPNVGKSSIINTLRSKRVCNVSPIAGETKVWQYITLMRRIFLIDCPGVVYPSGDTETDLVLKSVVRVEYLKNAEDHIQTVLERAKQEYIVRTYGIEQWQSHEDFLEKLAFKSGKLLKGGQPDISTVAKMVLNDWQRGKIPFFVKPPENEKDAAHKPASEAEASAEHVTKSAAENSDDKQLTSTVATKATEEKDALAPNSVAITMKVKQDLTKLSIMPDFCDDDIKPLAAVDEDDDALSSASDVSDEEDEQEEEKEEDKVAKIKQSKDCVTSSSGAFSVSKADVAASSSAPPEANSNKAASSDFKKPRGKPAAAAALAAKGKGKATKRALDIDLDDDEGGRSRVSGKEKRQAYNQQKVRKVGSQFYTNTNVKNRSYRK